MRIFRWLLMTVLLLLLSGAFAVLWVQEQFNKTRPIEPVVEVVIPKGSGLKETAHILAQNNVIQDKRWFELYARLYHLSEQLKAGEYGFVGNVSVADVAEKLVKGEVIVRAVTIPEGKALVEIKQILQENPYLSGDITIVLEEGDILPETYYFSRGESRNSVLERAKQAMQRELTAAFAGRAPQLPLKTEKELLILASIIEKETGVAQERAKVSSVFVNRLNLGMKLQTDPTVIYAVTHGEMNLGRPLYKKDLAYDSPYNTYVYAGLPPKPICSPGKAALLAAAHPDTTKYLYFVADGVTGGHRFATSLSEHNANVALYRKARQ